MLALLHLFLSAVLLLFPIVSQAEHAKPNHKHLRHAHAHAPVHAIDARRIPADFDALQWDSERKSHFHDAPSTSLSSTRSSWADPNGKMPLTKESEGSAHVLYTTVWNTIYVTAFPSVFASPSVPLEQSESSTSATASSSALVSAADSSSGPTPSAFASSAFLSVLTASLGTSTSSSMVSEASELTTSSTHKGESKFKDRTSSKSTSLSSSSSLSRFSSSSILSSSPSSSSSVFVQVSSLAELRSSSAVQTSAQHTTDPANIRVPTATYSLIHGSASYSPASQYLDVPVQTASPPKLATDLVAAGLDSVLQTAFPLFNGSGLIQANSSNDDDLRDLDTVPHMSRDGGHGGVINGHKIFCFADTSTYTAPTATEDGNWTGFVSNSIALDVGNGPYTGQRLVLQDPIGAFASSDGSQRTFIPWTDGEAAYGDQNDYSKRYAIWPWGSFVPLTNETSLLYAPITFQDNAANPQFQNAGVTLAALSVTEDGQPVVDREVPYLFPETDAQYGAGGGIRSWGPSGVGGTDGKVYVFGTHQSGLLLARAEADSVTDYDSYEYWDNSTSPSSWSTTPTTTPFVTFSLSSGDLFYSPMHGTFLLIFQTAYCDSSFYYSYLQTPSFIAPSYTATDYADIVENVYAYAWSDPVLLIKTPVLSDGKYTYDGGVHQGYFDEEDIVNGGDRMLLTWTAPTGADAASETNGYQLWSAEIRWA